MFEAKNWINNINLNIMSIVRFYSGTVKFALGWLDGIDKTVRQHLTQQGMLMKRGMATSSLYTSPDDTGLGLKSCVGVYLLELVRLLLQYKWGTIFRQELFWRMEEATKRNSKGVWLHEIEKVLKRFDSSLEWLMERIDHREKEIDRISLDDQMEEREKNQMIRSKRMKCIAGVFEEVEVLIDTHFSNDSRRPSPLRFLSKFLRTKLQLK